MGILSAKTAKGTGTMSNVTVHVPTAVMNLSASAPNGDVTADDIIAFYKAQLNDAAARIQQLEVGLGTVTNIAACALKVLADLGHEDAPGEFSFSADLTERMMGANLTLAEDFAGGIIVRFRERSTAEILLET